MHGWFNKQNEFTRLKDGETHSEFILRIYKDVHTAFSCRWFRVTYCGNELWIHNPYFKPSKHILNQLIDYAAQSNGRFTQITYSSDTHERTLWTAE